MSLMRFLLSPGGGFRTTQILRRRSTEIGERKGAAKFTISDGGKRLRVSWGGDNGSRSEFHSVWLRRNCHCAQCLSLYNQNVVRSHEMDPRVAVSAATVTEGGSVELRWTCGHEGHLSLDWLRRHCYSSHALEEARRNTTPKPLPQNTLPEMDSEELKEEYGIWRWLKTVNEYGVCLLTGVPCTTEGGLEITKKVSPHLQETFYGGHSVVKVEDNPMTLCHGPGYIEPHMDVPMYESQTGLTLLQCVRNDSCVAGGDTIVVDALAVAEKLRVTHPHHFATLVRVPATFQRIHYERENPVHMAYRSPHIQINGHGQVIKLRWAPQHEGPLQVPEEDIEPYYDAHLCLAKAVNNDCESKVYHRLRPREMLVLNNHRMLHGRTAIRLNGGARVFNNFSMNIDDFKSRLQVLCAKYDPDYQPKNILNHDFSFSTAAQTT